MEKIKVLVVDDSSVMRKLITNMVEFDPQITVVDTAMNGFFALKKIEKYDIDVILLDIQMPEMDGIEFLEKCKELEIDIPIVVLSSLGKNRPAITLKCLSLGAKDFIIKPSGTISLDIAKVKDEVISKVKFFYKENPKHNKIKKDELKEVIDGFSLKKTTIEANKESATPLIIPDPLEIEKKINSKKSLKVVVIGISTGGPHALRVIMPSFPSTFPLPILIVQHMPAGFTYEFAKGLNDICKLSVKEAEDGEPLERGTIYIAPGNYHLFVQNLNGKNCIGLNTSAPVCGHKPSVEVLFRNVLEIFGGRVISVIMTGMGKDGANAIKKLKLSGGIALAQSEKSCVVFGMPKVAIEMGGIDEIVDLKNMPRRIIEITNMILS